MRIVVLPEELRHAPTTTVHLGCGKEHDVEDGSFECDECANAVEASLDLKASGWRIGVQDEQDEDESDGINASPAAIDLAKKLNINLAAVEGTGRDGLITKADVQKVADE